MAYSIPPGTKFATINLTHCSVADDFGDLTMLSNELSVHRRRLFDLGADFDRDIGARSAEHFRTANLVLMASAASTLPTVRDEEWLRLDHRAFMLFYAILMHGIPNFWTAAVASGGTTDVRTAVLHFSPSLPFYRTPYAVPTRVDAETLRGADAVVGGMVQVFTSNDFGRLRRGVNALVAAWKQVSVADRLHGCVRALDAVMKLPPNKSRVEFANRLPLFAKGTRVADIAEAAYRLRSYNEHLSEWPQQLGHVALADRPAFVARHAFYAEVVTGFVYRTLLANATLLSLFRTDEGIDAFWSTGRGAWPHQIDLRTEASRFQYIEQ